MPEIKSRDNKLKEIPKRKDNIIKFNFSKKPTIFIGPDKYSDASKGKILFMSTNKNTDRLS